MSEEEIIILFKNSERYVQLTEENRQFFQPLLKWFDKKYIPKNIGWNKESQNDWSTIINIENVHYEVLATIKNNQIDRVQIGIDTKTFNSYFEFGDLLKENVFLVIHEWEKEIYEINQKGE